MHKNRVDARKSGEFISMFRSNVNVEENKVEHACRKLFEKNFRRGFSVAYLRGVNDVG